jgi:membrane protease YdiL (CAAX protease family)
MEAAKIHLKTLFFAVLSILIIEIFGRILGNSGISTLSTIGLLRIMEIGVLTGIVIFFEGGLSVIGVHTASILNGIRKGVLWSLAFGLFVALLALVLFAVGIDPLPYVKIRLPDHSRAIFLFFIVGGIIAPVAEEFFFRGIIFTFFRRWGFLFSLCFTSIIFAALHLVASGIPVVQLVGGILFAVAFEVEKNLFAPTVIHISGNLAIFSISLISF